MDIIKELQDIFRDIFDDDELVLTSETSAEDIEDWDSLTHMQIILAVEAHFGVKFKTEEIIGLKNVGEFINCLNQKRGVKR